MSEQDGRQAVVQQRPITNDRDEWKAYWKAQGQSWRTEPEIDKERQKYLDGRRSIVPNIEQVIYPFKDIKLGRADIEWLLATHQNGRGPIDWSDESQREREGLDLRGADLRQVNLRNLPLACTLGGLTWDYWASSTEEQHNMASVQMNDAILNEAHLEGAILIRAHLERADLRRAYLERADLRRAYLERADLWQANLKAALLTRAHLDGASLDDVLLSDEKGIGPRLADIRWSDVNLMVVKWESMKMLGDEYKALQKNLSGKLKDRATRLHEYETVVRTYRQLAVALRSQGLNENAANFTYKAEKLQRAVFWHQRKFGQYLFSFFLDLLAGYGYKPWRSFIAYLLVITAFATIYFITGRIIGPMLSPLGSIVFSMTSFHGRGFFPGGIGLDDPLTVLAAIEAFVGLLIEVTFIATLTQRLFGK